MKAHKGDEIVCHCAERAGYFLADVEDSESISSGDIRFEWTAPLAPDLPHCHVCSTCDQTVGYFLGGRWRVRTRRGWLE
jgi:hypothetical protein